MVTATAPIPAAPPAAGPHAEYDRRLADLRAAIARLERQRAWAGNARFAVALAVPVLVIVLAAARSLSPAWLLLPAGGVGALSGGFARASQRPGPAPRGGGVHSPRPAPAQR